MRPVVHRLIALGPLPGEDDERPLDEMTALLNSYEKLLAALTPPATDEEAMALLTIFNPSTEDPCFGLAWALVHVIETAPNWPAAPTTTPMGRAIEAQLQGSDEPWKQILWERILHWRENQQGEGPTAQSG